MKWSLMILAILIATVTSAQIIYTYDSVTQTQTWMFSKSNPSRIIQWRDTGRIQDRHVTEYYWNGFRKVEYSERYSMKYDTLWEWDYRGVLNHVAVYSDIGYLSIDYDDSTGLVRQRGEYKILGKLQPPVLIQDTVNHTKYTCKPCDYGCYAPTGTWYTFHTNGQLESSGSYLPIQFESEQAYQDTLSFESPCYPPGTVVLVVTQGDSILRDGNWKFYDDQGKLIREEFYEGGLLKSTTQY